MPLVSLVAFDGEGWTPVYGEDDPIDMDAIPHTGSFVKTEKNGICTVYEVLAVAYFAQPSQSVKLHLGKPSSEADFYGLRLRSLSELSGRS